MIHAISDNAGPAGTVTAMGTGLAGFLAVATPVLQFACLCISFVVGVLTAIWYARKLRKGP